MKTESIRFADLTPDDFLGALDTLGFHCDGRFLALNSYENRVYQVGLDDNSLIVVKFYRPNRWSDDAILEEHTFTQELADCDISVVPPTAIDGRTLHAAEGFRLAVYPCRGGRAPELDDLDMLEQLGRLVARIHLVGEQEDFQHRPSIDVDSYLVEPSNTVMQSGYLPFELEETYEALVGEIRDAVELCVERSGGYDVIRLHGDFHPGNVLVNNGVFHIVDFDDCRSGPSVQDLWMFLSGDREEQRPQLHALLDGYEQFRSFDASELHLVEALRSLRIVHYTGWLARRFDDPAFQRAFPWFESARYWDEHILSLREQLAAMQEAPLEWMGD